MPVSHCAWLGLDGGFELERGVFTGWLQSCRLICASNTDEKKVVYGQGVNVVGNGIVIPSCRLH